MCTLCNLHALFACLTLCNPMDCSLPGSSVHGIFQVRILESVAISFSREISPTHGSKLCLLDVLHCQVDYLQLSHLWSPWLYVCTHVKLLQLCPILCNPMDYSLPDSSVHGIFQARILESATIPSSGDLPNPWIKPVSPGSPAWAGGFFITKSTVKPLKSLYSYAEFWKIVRIIHMGPFDCVDQNKLWKILKGMEISDHLTCLLRNLHEGQIATVRTGHGTTDGFQSRKGVTPRLYIATLLI